MVRRFDVYCNGGWDGCTTYEDECKDGDYVSASDYDELVDAARWERECEAVSRHDIIRRLYALYLKHGQEYTDSVMEEFAAIGHAARAAVDALVGEG